MSIKNNIISFAGGDDSIPLENRFFNLLTFFGGWMSLSGVVINLFLSADLILNICAFSAMIFCWGAFYLSRFKGKFEIGKWLLTMFLFVLLSFIFTVNNGSSGPLLYLYMNFFLLLILVWNGKTRNLLIGLFILNIIGFFWIEYSFPDFIKPYVNNETRLIDVYFSYFLYLILLGVIMMFTRNGYISEKEKAQKSDQLKTAFLANMSHEIRTPMNAILGFTQLLESDISSEKKASYLKIINDSGHSLLRLIEDIIDVSQIEAGELELYEEETNLNLLLSKLVLTFNQVLSKYPEKSIKIIQLNGEEGLVIQTDGTRLKQILTNLIHNAIKYTETGDITIGYTVKEEVLKFFVKDSGQGIKPEHISEIFDRFRKIETDQSKKIQPGTGIGLSISKHLTELLGGEMDVKSEFGLGSEFFFTIRYIPIRIDKQKRVKPKESTAFKSADFTGRTILIAEDENANFFFLKKVLDRTGADVIRARNGQEAVDLFSVHPEIDIVLMDIMMPEMNGYQATAIIKEKNPDIPVIAQTALAMEGDAKKVTDAGCNDYLSKPIRMNDLLEKLSVYLPNQTSE